MERNSNAIGVRSCRDGALHIATGVIGVEELLLRKSSDVYCSGGVIFNDSRVAKGTSDGIDCSLGARASEEDSHED